MKSTDSPPRRRGAGSFRILSLCAAAAAAAAMGIVTVTTSAPGAGDQSATFVARHGNSPVTSASVAPVGPAAPHVVATRYAGKGWLGAEWFNANRAK
jgi:hypothetical protein